MSICPRIVSLMGSLLLLAPSADAQAPVIVAELNADNWDQLVPSGKEVDAIYGDLVLRNEHLTAVIARPVATRNANMTVKSVGGCLIDLASRRSPSDQLSAFYPCRRLHPFTDFSIVGPTSDTVADASASVTVTSPESDTGPTVEVTWSLAAQDPFIGITTKWTNTTAAEIMIAIEDDVRADGGKEIMEKSPNGEHALFTIHDVYWGQAYGLSADKTIRSNSNARESVLQYLVDGDSNVVLKPGESFELRRRLFVDTNLPGVKTMHEFIAENQPLPRESIYQVTAGGTPVPRAILEWSQDNVVRGRTTADDRGQGSVRLADGEWNVAVNITGKKYEAAPVTVAGESLLTISPLDYHAGVVDLSVVDGDGSPLPAKIEFRGYNSTPTPDFGPETAAHFVKNLAYTPNGHVTMPIIAGTYDLIVSHGSEFDAEFTKITVEPGKTATAKFQLARSVQTPGWVSPTSPTQFTNAESGRDWCLVYSLQIALDYFGGQCELELIEEDLLVVGGFGDAAGAEFRAGAGRQDHVHRADV